MSFFEQLPDELILSVLEHLKPIPAYHAKDYVNPWHPRFRQNSKRTAELSTICLVSKKISRITETVLYSSLTVCSGEWPTYPRLFCLVSALLRNPSRTRYVRYLENILIHDYRLEVCDYRKGDRCCHIRGWEEDCRVLHEAARQFWRGTFLEDWAHCLRTRPGQALFALIVALSPNLAHLTLDVSNWSSPLLAFLSPQYSSVASATSFHGFPKLNRLCVFTDWDLGFGVENEMYCRNVAQLKKLSTLRHYQQTSLCQTFVSWSDDVSFEHLVTLCLDDCQITVSQVASLVRGCSALKYCSILWVKEYYGWDHQWKDLLSALSSTKTTLEYLDLRFSQDIIEYDTDPDYDSSLDQKPKKQPDGFADFMKLKALTLSDVILLGLQTRIDSSPYVRPENPISKCLPRSLANLTIEMHRGVLQDASLSLWDLANDLHLLPALRRVAIHGAMLGEPFMTSVQKTRSLLTRFLEQGVTFVPPDWPDCRGELDGRTVNEEEY